MEYKLIRSRRKTVSIKINKDADIIVSAPYKCSLKFINDFVESKNNWITVHVNDVKNKHNETNEFFKYEKVYLFGNEYQVIDNDNHYLIGDYYIKHTKASNKQKVIKTFIIKIANQYLTNRIQEVSKILNIEYKNVQIISARKKWGSCNNLHQIKLNFRLIMLDKYLIDYVICHELCHIKELNHSKEFWELLSNIGFNKQTVRKRMSKFSFTLELF